MDDEQNGSATAVEGAEESAHVAEDQGRDAQAETLESVGAEGLLRTLLNPPKESGQEGSPETEVVEQSEDQAEEDQVEAGEDDGEGEADADLTSQPPRAIAKLQKRVGKLTARAKAAEEAKASLEAEVARLKAVRDQEPEAEAPAVGNDRLAGMSAAQLSKAEAAAEQLSTDIEDFLDGTADGAQSKRLEAFKEAQGLDDGALKKVLRRMQKLVGKEIPARREFLKHEQAAESRALELFPWWKAPESEDYQQAMAVVRSMPEMRQRLPHWKVAAGVYVLGLQALKARQAEGAKAKAATNGAGKVVIPVKAPGRPSAAAAKVPAAEARVRQARELMESGDPKGVEEYTRAVLAS